MCCFLGLISSRVKPIWHKVFSLLNQETSYKRSTRQKAKRASMDEEYMLQVLQASAILILEGEEYKFLLI